MHAHEEWVGRCIDLGLCNAADWWIGHMVTAFPNRPEINHRHVGSFDRSTIEKFGKGMEGLRSQVEGVPNADFQARATRDLDALEAAANMLAELKAHGRNEHLRQLELMQQPQASAPPAAPPMPATTPQPEEEEPELEPEEEPPEPEKETGDHSATGVMQASSEPLPESSEQGEPIAELEQFNTDLLDPRSIQNVDAFLVVFDRTSSVLDEVRDPWAIKQIVDIAEKLRMLVDLLSLGQRCEKKAKKLRFDALYKASQLFDPPPRGRPSLNGQTDPLNCFTEYQRKLVTLLRPFEPQDYRRIRDQGIEDGTLSEKSFKAPATPKKQEKSGTEHLNPRRFMYDFLADFRQNLTLSYRLDQVEDWASDSIVLENLGPVLQQYTEFTIALSGLLQRKMLEKEMANLTLQK
jgi:hypothetical protein